MREMVCIGGPLDGRRVTVPAEMRLVEMALPVRAPIFAVEPENGRTGYELVTSADFIRTATYKRVTLVDGGKGGEPAPLFALIPLGCEDGVVARLLEGYRRPVVMRESGVDDTQAPLCLTGDT